MQAKLCHLFQFSLIDDQVEAFFSNPEQEDSIVSNVENKVNERLESCKKEKDKLKVIFEVFLTTYFTLRVIYYIKWAKTAGY